MPRRAWSASFSASNWLGDHGIWLIAGVTAVLSITRSSSSSSKFETPMDFTNPSVCARIICSHRAGARSEEHTSELQSRGHIVCRLLLEKKQLAREGPCDPG